ncbi:hypothetical protein, partial [Pyramidobacter piscolens]|uniref:hypothetical protein n=1 Tax=Pyramidobacter piscolens TaxID=638849 RepID=UPI0028EA4261
IHRSIQPPMQHHKIGQRITFFGSFFPQVFVRMDPLPSQILPLLSQDIPEALFEAYFKFL